MKHLLRKIIDLHLLLLQALKLTRHQNYNDNTYNCKISYSRNASKWTYIDQNTLYKTNFEHEKTPNISNQLSDRDTQNQLSDKDTQNQLLYKER
ncbi:15418_t:CDS:1 [Funneliformis mosseae]|uniref:15418_t:CDS:1 n=1 Tax=Funneliformis mosseae TaxID=27381 RepID=A0A9N9D3J4_FUNMO|nr:15418_t:CDS:1 [Funneliformis mosseae]